MGPGFSYVVGSAHSGSFAAFWCSIHWHFPPASWSGSTFHFHKVRKTPQLLETVWSLFLTAVLRSSLFSFNLLQAIQAEAFLTLDRGDLGRRLNLNVFLYVTQIFCRALQQKTLLHVDRLKANICTHGSLNLRCNKRKGLPYRYLELVPTHLIPF